jgi:hypothetical protein
LFLNTELQAHHLELDFYDKFYKPGAYLKTHATHMEQWHKDSKKRGISGSECSSASYSSSIYPAVPPIIVLTRAESFKQFFKEWAV